MLLLDDREAFQLRILVLVPVVLGLLSMLLPSSAIELKDAWPDGPVNIQVNTDSHGKLAFNSLTEFHKKQPEHVVINDATHDELILCPGISSKTASLILSERRFGQFFDWRDLQDRIKGIGPGTIQRLQEAGVRLSAEPARIFDKQ